MSSVETSYAQKLLTEVMQRMTEKTPFDFDVIYAALREFRSTPYDNVGHSIEVAVRMMFSLRWRDSRTIRKYSR